MDGFLKECGMQHIQWVMGFCPACLAVDLLSQIFYNIGYKFSIESKGRGGSDSSDVSLQELVLLLLWKNVQFF